jgi:NAD(P)-dependent dehydrogenase (short-subunit alcohol dehydrogenase family)
MGRLSGKTALITGGSSGIGLATAKLFTNEGARVAVTGRDPESLSKAKLEMTELMAVQSDASSVAQIDALMKKIGERFGKLDVLFVNAGVAHAAPSEYVTEAMVDEMLAVNFKGAFFTVQKALPLLNQGSSVIVTTSLTNKMGSPGFGIYGACKAAQLSLIQTLGLELIGRGIRVNGICPGPIDTPMYGRVGLPKEMETGLKAVITGKSPIKRWGHPDEVARVALFLASEESSYIVGNEIVVDGGMNLL